ncbi:hypothetical protein [Methyloceanibacter sp.]|uniref:hypothetical protein n=1 Tax=Methyloceanibacter sp. TaxID=1965321 RepID=UPI002C06BA18|nr:hypothetical protein [Methyloceanibacter sp.]HML91720.1 hypothetical protein [Methyloceanibacter sp.]
MRTLVKEVTTKIRKVHKEVYDDEGELNLSKAEIEALEDAERLAELYKDVVPRPYVITGDHLFVLPREQDSD